MFYVVESKLKKLDIRIKYLESCKKTDSFFHYFCVYYLILVLQVKLYKDFMYDEDTVIQTLERSLDELKRAKLDLPPPATKDELPSRQFGVFTEPSFEQIVGHRTESFTEKEKETNEIVTLRREAARESVEIDNRESQVSASDSVGNAGTDVDSISMSSRYTIDSETSICESTSSSIVECTRL